MQYIKTTREFFDKNLLFSFVYRLCYFDNVSVVMHSGLLLVSHNPDNIQSYIELIFFLTYSVKFFIDSLQVYLIYSFLPCSITVSLVPLSLQRQAQQLKAEGWQIHRSNGKVVFCVFVAQPYRFRTYAIIAIHKLYYFIMNYYIFLREMDSR